MRTLGGMAAQGRCPPRKWPGTRGNGYPAFSLPIPKFSPPRYNYERSASLAAALRVLVGSQLAKRVAEGGQLAPRVVAAKTNSPSELTTLTPGPRGTC